MIRPDKLYETFTNEGVGFYTGVPDSLFRSFLKYLQENAPHGSHVITANEGLAIGLATGYNLSTGKLPLVYLQNSGLGNTINPLTSLADKEMYGIPMLLLIGYRGRPGVKDEPQHFKMGRITIPLLQTLEIPYEILSEDAERTRASISAMTTRALKEQRPTAVLVPENIFDEYDGMPSTVSYSLVREQVIGRLIEGLNGTETVVCTTGKIGREFYEQNNLAGKKISKYLLSVGSMGHANHIALGIKMHSSEKLVMLDGDGALLMHMGALSTIPQWAQNGFVHIVINNGCHESVGGQPTGAFGIDLCSIALSFGYRSATCISTEKELTKWIRDELPGGSSQFVEIRTNASSRPDLGRPEGNPADWKKQFMDKTDQS